MACDEEQSDKVDIESLSPCFSMQSYQSLVDDQDHHSYSEPDKVDMESLSCFGVQPYQGSYGSVQPANFYPQNSYGVISQSYGE